LAGSTSDRRPEVAGSTATRRPESIGSAGDRRFGGLPAPALAAHPVRQDQAEAGSVQGHEPEGVLVLTPLGAAVGGTGPGQPPGTGLDGELGRAIRARHGATGALTSAGRVTTSLCRETFGPHAIGVRHNCSGAS
jgi:hypothetical protein